MFVNIHKKDGMIKIKTDSKTIKRKVVESSTEADLCVIEAGYDQSTNYSCLIIIILEPKLMLWVIPI